MTGLRPGAGVINRRALGLGAAALIGSVAAPAALRAEEPATPSTANANAGVYRLRIGDVRATVISDGQIAFPAWPTYAPDVTEAEAAAAMRRRDLTPPSYRLDANALLLEIGERRLLIDAGWGAFAPSVGALAGALASIGVDPDAIDTVVLSHIHPDHVGGLTNADGDRVFERADIVVAAAELAQWRGDDAFGAMTIDPAFEPLFAASARTVFDRGARLRDAAPGEEIAHGVTLVALPGHTVGHCGVRIASGDDELLYVADCFHEQAFDLDHPNWRTVFDYAPAQAARTRRAMLDRAAVDRTLLMAFHMPFPGLGRVSATADGYLWAPQPWRLGVEEEG